MTTWNTILARCYVVTSFCNIWWHHFATFDDIILQNWHLFMWLGHFRFWIYCNSIVVFTTYWKFRCCCIRCLFGINECQQLVYTFILPFIPNMILFSDSNDTTVSITFPLTYAQLMNTRLVTMSASLHTQTGLHCLTIQVLHTWVWFLNASFTSVHSNLEYGLALLTESFSPLRSVLHNLSCWSPKQKWIYTV